MFLIDSHCHIDILDYEKLHKNFHDVLEKAKKNHVNFLLTVSTSLSNCKMILNKTKNYPNIKNSCGVHPLSKEKYFINDLIKTAQDKNVIAIGETGLDYYRKNDKKKQQKFFKQHLFASFHLKKPVIIHNRNADQDIINIMHNEKYYKGIIHCFNSSNINVLRKFIDMGLYISLSGIVTFKNSYYLRNLIKFIPIERLLIETDSPYLTPIPYRGQQNQPAYLKYIAICIAKIKNIELNEIADITTKNFFNLFKYTIKN